VAAEGLDSPSQNSRLYESHVGLPANLDSQRQPSAVSQNHIKPSRRVEGAWNVFDKRCRPGDEFHDHLALALRTKIWTCWFSSAYSMRLDRGQ
jgi:hypothetical protein